MKQRRALYVLPALAARSGPDGAFVLTRKFLDGILQYVERWPGPVIVCLHRSEEMDDNLDHVFVRSAEVPFGLEWIPRDQVALAELISDARLVLGSLVDQHTGLASMCRRVETPCVYVTEYNLRTRRQIIRTQTSNPLLRVRREWWTSRLERRYERAVRLADGVQCNGTPTHEAYRSLNRSPLLYFDTRVRESDLVSLQAIEHRTGNLTRNGPLRLAFSGRLIAMKGADHLPLVAAELKQLNVPFTMDICGGGELEPSLREAIRRLELQDSVHLRGVLDFRTELMPLMARHIDLFVCCHPQGDPSCTYLETMSCGTPIIGYDNDAFLGIVQTSGVGWLTPLGRPRELAREIARLHTDRTALASAALAAREFASQHTFERTMQARIDHMLSCCREQKDSGVSGGSASSSDHESSSGAHAGARA